jgi:hypothetical protein
MFKKLTNVLVLFLGCLLLGYSNPTVSATAFTFLSQQSIQKKSALVATSSETLNKSSRYSEENLLSFLEKVYYDNEEIHESEHSDSTNNNSFLCHSVNDNSVVLSTAKKGSFLTTTVNRGILKNNRLFILFHSWKFHLI